MIILPTVGLPAEVQKALVSFGESDKGEHLWKDKHVQEFLVKVMSDQSRENSETYLRCVDLVVDVSNLREPLQKVLIHSGALRLAVCSIETHDVLLKLGAVEVLSKL